MRFHFENLVLDAGRRELLRDGAVVAVEPQVFDLLVYLVENRDRVVSKDDVLNAVWHGRIVSESTLTTRINAARKALGDSGELQRLIRTLPRKGFRFVGEVKDGLVPTVRELVRPTPAPWPALALPDRPSIAVLPFQNLSGDPEQDYFADGIVEDLITALSRFKSLFVIARNSSFTFKGKAVDVREVGRALGVRYVPTSMPVVTTTLQLGQERQRWKSLNGRCRRVSRPSLVLYRAGWWKRRKPWLECAQSTQICASAIWQLKEGWPHECGAPKTEPL